MVFDRSAQTAWNGAPRCQVILDSGERCGHPCVKREDGSFLPTCRMHPVDDATGLVTLPSKLHGNLALPTGLVDRFRDLLDSPDLLGLRAGNALLKSRISQLLERVDADSTPHVDILSQVRTAYALMQNGHLSNDADARASGIEKMLEAVEGAQTEQDVWDEILTLLDERRQYTAAEIIRLKDSGHMLTVKDVQKITAFMLETLQAHVPDPRYVRSIKHEFQHRLEARQANDGLPSQVLSQFVVGAPSSIQASYLDHAFDDELFVLRQDSALVWLRVEMLVARLPKPDDDLAQVAMQEVRAGLDAYRRGHMKGEAYSRQIGLEQIEKAFDPRTAEREIWDEIVRWLALHRQLARVETKRRGIESKYLMIERVMFMIAAFLSSVEAYIEDVAAAVRTEFESRLYYVDTP